MSEPFTHEYRWKKGPDGRPNHVRADLYGKRCRIVATGSKMYSVLLEFEDGARVVTSRRAIRKLEPNPTARVPRAKGDKP